MHQVKTPINALNQLIDFLSSEQVSYAYHYDKYIKYPL